MRALVLQFVFLACIPLAFAAPHVGVLLYYWFSLFNPHKLVWGGLPIDWGKLIVACTVIAWLASKEVKKLPVGALNGLFIVFFLWTVFTTVTAQYPSNAWGELLEWTKVVIMALLSTTMMTNRTRLHAFVWVAVIGVGYYGLRGGLFTVVTAGNYYVLGPPGTYMFNTNEVARAFLMTIPLSYFLALHSKHKLARTGFFVLTGLLALALIGTTSRTAALALGFMIALWWLRSRYKVVAAIALVIVGAGALALLPEQRTSALFEKYLSVQDYEEDTSFQSRIAIWEGVLEIANRSPVFGGGFGAIEKKTGRAPHSNYFEVLGEHGYVGLAIYLLLVTFAVAYAGALYRRTRRISNLKWASDLAMLLQISFICYLFAGLTKNHGFFEIFYMQLAMLVCLRRIVAETLQKPTAGAYDRFGAAAPREPAAVPGAAAPRTSGPR